MKGRMTKEVPRAPMKVGNCSTMTDYADEKVSHRHKAIIDRTRNGRLQARQSSGN